MAEPLLLLVHRIPYPPNKGDKVRSWNLLRHLAEHYTISLGTFVDDAADLAHVDVLRKHAVDVHVARLRSDLAKLRSFSGFLNHEPLSLPYYRDASMRVWVRETVRRRGISKALVFSSQMAQYVEGIALDRLVIDFVDVDSDKWRQYAETRRWPMSAIYRREARLLARFEANAAERASASLFVTQAEAELFRTANPALGARIHALANGVDTEFFSPDPSRSSPYAAGERALVFTGAMDYWPNVDAVTWFAQTALPRIAAEVPEVRLHVVGSRPAQAVRDLAQSPNVAVHADVPDVRPYIQHADVAVVPMRLGRGIQNKILEAMAMARPTVVSATCMASLSARPGDEVLVARSADAFANETLRLLRHPDRAIGARARARVLADYSWSHNLAALSRYLGDGDAASVVANADVGAPALAGEGR